MSTAAIVTVPGHHMPLHMAAGNGAIPNAAITTFLKDLAIKLGDTSGPPYTLTPHMVLAPNVLLGQIPYLVGDHRYVEFTGNPKYSKQHILFRPVTVKPYFRGSAIDHHELLAYGIMRDQLDSVQSEQDTDRSLDARLAQAALANGASTDADDVDFDGQPFFVTSSIKKFNPNSADFGTYQTSFTGGLTFENVKLGLDILYQRMSMSGENLRLWEYPVELWVSADKLTTAEDIVKLATLIPRPGLGVANGGAAGDLNTGGNTNTLVARNLIPRVLEHAIPGSYNAWHLQSLAPFAKPLIKATPPDPIFPVYFPRGSDPNAINEEKAGFLVSMGFRWRTAIGHVRFTYS